MHLLVCEATMGKEDKQEKFLLNMLLSNVFLAPKLSGT